MQYLKDKKWITITLLVIHVIVLLLAFVIFRLVDLNKDIHYLIILGTQLILAVIPFALIILHIADTKIYKDLSEQFWFKFLLFVGFSVYLIAANTYASNMINEVFKLDSELFPNTTIILTFIYIFNIFQYLYSLIYWFSGGALFLIILIFIFKLEYKKLMYFLITITYFTMVSGFLVGTEKNAKRYIPVFANITDFNKKHVCLNIEDTKRFQGLIYLSNDKVLTSYLSKDSKGFFLEYSIKECVYDEGRVHRHPEESI